MAHPVENTVCPTCNAPAGSPCRDENGSTVGPHKPRKDMWKAAAGYPLGEG